MYVKLCLLYCIVHTKSSTVIVKVVSYSTIYLLMLSFNTRDFDVVCYQMVHQNSWAKILCHRSRTFRRQLDSCCRPTTRTWTSLSWHNGTVTRSVMVFRHCSTAVMASLIGLIMTFSELLPRIVTASCHPVWMLSLFAVDRSRLRCPLSWFESVFTCTAGYWIWVERMCWICLIDLVTWQTCCVHVYLKCRLWSCDRSLCC